MPTQKQAHEVYGEPPYINSPYPEEIVQIHDPDTRGEKEVVDLIDEYWPAKIDELVAISGEEYENGYSGSFIRHVLRTHFISAEETEQNRQPAQPPMNEVAEPRSGEEEMAEGLHQIFRAGLRLGLQTNVPHEEAVQEFRTGFIEGSEVKREIDL